MDAFAVSVGSGISLKKSNSERCYHYRYVFWRISVFMPLVGWFAGLSFREFIVSFDHWIAFGLLSIIGGKMLYEAWQEEDEEEVGTDFRNLYVLLTLAIATSIDALAIGLGFSVIKTPIITAAVIIGIITFLLSFSGVFLGSKFGHLFEKQAEIIGGFVLIGIGFKILLEHL